MHFRLKLTPGSSRCQNPSISKLIIEGAAKSHELRNRDIGRPSSGAKDNIAYHNQHRPYGFIGGLKWAIRRTDGITLCHALAAFGTDTAQYGGDRAGVGAGGR